MPLTMYRAAGWRPRDIHVLEKDLIHATLPSVLAKTVASETPAAVGVDSEELLGKTGISAALAGIDMTTLLSWLGFSLNMVIGDFSLANSTTLTDVTRLRTGTLLSGKTYAIFGNMLVTCATADPDMRLALTGPTGTLAASCMTTPDSGAEDGDFVEAMATQTNLFPLAAGVQMSVQWAGTIQTTSSARVQVQIKQQTSDAVPIIVKEGSFFGAILMNAV